MSEKTSTWSTRVFTGAFWAAILAVALYLIARNLGVVGNVVTVLLGFGMVVLVHEFGHFIIAKLGGIKVEAFSIFMPPTLLGIRKTRQGFKFRFLPSFSSNREEEEPTGEEEPTEYRIGLFPFGGYVKLLGQEDTGPVKQVDDPRSYAKKPASTRIAVLTAGVTFNVISAAIIFMVVFMVGIDLPPAVVGDVVPRSPAAEAGLRPGDEFLMIDGQTEDLDFSNVLIAGALSDVNEPIRATVRHSDGEVEDVTLVARDLPTSPFREFGILQSSSLKIAPIEEPNVLYERTGLLPGDRIVRADGTDVDAYWQFAEVAGRTLDPNLQVTAERETDEGAETVKTELPLQWTVAEGIGVEQETDLSHVYSMVPRLLVAQVTGGANASAADEDGLRTGDIILAVADVEYPTYSELREITADYEDKSLPVEVLRADANGVEQTMTITVEPKRAPGQDRVIIGFFPVLDARHPVVAKTIQTEDGPSPLDIPRGATITAVNNEPVANFYEIVEKIRRWEGQPIVLQYRLDGNEGGVTLQTAQVANGIRVEAHLPETIPFAPLERRYKATGPIDALGMGYRRTWSFIAQTYITLKRLITGLISPDNLMGPVGIMTVSYQIVAEQPFVNYVYFLGLISATIAVINFLPVPPFDGGLVVLTLVEKVKGSALTERTQGILAYTGWVLVLILLVYVTFNDVMRSFFS